MNIQTQRDIAAILTPYFAPDGLINKCLEFAKGLEHVMDFTRLRALGSLFSMINQSVRYVLNYDQNHPDFPMQVRVIFCVYPVPFFLAYFVCTIQLCFLLEFNAKRFIYDTMRKSRAMPFCTSPFCGQILLNVHETFHLFWKRFLLIL